MVRMLRKLLVSFYIAVVMFSNVPYQFFSAMLDGYLDTRNVVDKFWLAQKDSDVVDTFTPIRHAIESTKVSTAFAATQGDGKIIYSTTVDATPRVRDYVSSTNTFSAAGNTVAGAAAGLFTVVKASPTKDEYIAAYVNSSNNLQVMCFNGTTWTNEWSVALGSATTRRFDVAYEKTSGDAMVVYSTNVNNTNELAYRTKLGSAACGSANWSAAPNLDPIRTTGIVAWVRLEASPAASSNNIALAWADTNSDLSAMIWTGASWAIAEPSAALETSLEVASAAQDTESFDIAWESTAGNLMVAWGLTQASTCTAGTTISTTNCIRYARYTNAWSAVAAIPTVADPATHLDMSSNPNSNEIVLAALDNSQADLSAAYWSGTAWTGQANLDTGTQAAAAGQKYVATGWLISGATTRSVIAYYKSAATAVNWFVGNAGVFTAQTAFTTNPVLGAQRYYDIDTDPYNKDRLILTVNDGNSDIHGKRLIMTSTPTFTWSDSSGGNPVETTTGSSVAKPYDFEYARFASAPSATLTIGVTAGSKLASVNSGATSQTANDPACTSAATCAAFTLLPNTSETLTSVKLTQTGTTNGTTNLSNVAIFYDTDGNYSNGTTGQFGTTVTSLTSNTATISGSLAMTSGVTYYLYVRYDVVNGTADPAGGETVNWQIAANADVVSGGGSTKSGAPVALAGTQTVKPNAASVTYQLNSDGGRSGYSATITGNGFGAAPVGSRGTCAGAVNTGCVQFVVGGNATVATADVTAWANRSITFTVNSALASNGGTNGLQVVSGSQTEATPLTFFVYPTITSITNCNKAGFSSGAFAREYDATDSACPNTLKDGSIVITGDHFGAAGTVSILGSTATQAAVAAFCSGAAYNTTCTAVQVPTAIASNAYTGSVIVTRTSDSKTDTLAGFRILPRITGFTPTSASNGTAVAINGDHFCQTGTCPTSFGASDKVTFNSAVAATTFTSWTDTAMTTAVPAGATTGNVTLTSNSFDSNPSSFTVLSNTPADPTSLNQYSDSGLLTAIPTGGGDNSTPLYLTMTMSVPGISGGTLYPEVEYKAVGTAFTCTGTASCASATEGTGVAGPGPISCSNTANACSIAISPADNVYHWQARVCHNKGGTHTTSCGGTGDFPSAWVSFGGNAESATDFQLDANPPVITLISSGSPGTNSATITWSTAGEVSSTQVQYNTTGSFVTNCATNSDCTTLTDTSPRVNNHSVTLSNLNSNTTYSYRVRSIDASGNEAISSVSTFQTGSVTQPSKTVKFGITGETATIDAGGSINKSFSIYIPESATTTKSIFVEIRGVYSAGAQIPMFTVQVNSETAIMYTFPGGTGVVPFKILHQVNSLTTTPNGNNLTIIVPSDPIPAAPVDILSADVYVNYSYTP